MRSSAPNFADEANPLIDMGLSVQPIFWITSDGKCGCGYSDKPRPWADGNPCPEESWGKHPIFEHGKAIPPTCNKDDIARIGKDYPDANIAIGLGIPLFQHDGMPIVMSLDIDVPEGHPKITNGNGVKDGRKGWRDLCKRGIPQISPNWKTGSGGNGILYLSNRTDVTTTEIAEGVTLRASKNQFALVPHSNHRLGDYTWVKRDIPLEFIPDDLIPPRERSSSKSAVALEGMVYPGDRHRSLISLLGTLKNKGFTQQTMLDTALAFNATQCDPPKDESYIREQVEWCFSHWTPPTKVEMTRGDRMLIKLARKDEDFTRLYDGVDDNHREIINELVATLVHWCNCDIARVLRLLANSKRLKNYMGDTRGLRHHIELEADCAVDGFIDADCIEFLELGKNSLSVSPDLTVRDILQHNRFITRRDNKQMYYFDEHTVDGRRIGCFKEHGDRWLHEEIKKRLLHRMRTSNINEITSFVNEATYKDIDEIDNAPLNLIPLRNGVFDLDTGTLCDYDPDVPFFFIHPGAYNKALLGKETLAKKCIDAVLPPAGDEPEGTVSRATEFQEIGGAGFYRLCLYKKGLMLFGDKNTGKSVILAILRNSVGKDARARKTLQDLIKSRFAEAALYHKTSNIAADIGSLGIDAVGKFNEMTGQVDTQNCEKKGVDGFEFESYATHYYSTNDLPALSPKVQKAEAEAFYSRFILIETERRFVAEPDENDSSQVKDEGEILGPLLKEQENIDWATTYFIEGLRRVLTQHGFSKGESAFNVEYRWKLHTDSLAAFAGAYHLEYKPGVHVPASEFRGLYETFCTKNEMEQASDVSVGMRLPHLVPGVAKFDSGGKKWWRNLKMDGYTPTIDLTPTPKYAEPVNEGQERLTQYD